MRIPGGRTDYGATVAQIDTVDKVCGIMREDAGIPSKAIAHDPVPRLSVYRLNRAQQVRLNLLADVVAQIMTKPTICPEAIPIR